jgi:Arc/MetJ-type ribon-helix-helix transcriptional regulator
MSERVTLKIPRPIYDRLHAVIEGSGYRSVNEFVVYVLRELLAERARDDVSPLTAREVELLRRRLQNLGYLE